MDGSIIAYTFSNDSANIPHKSENPVDLKSGREAANVEEGESRYRLHYNDEDENRVRDQPGLDHERITPSARSEEHTSELQSRGHLVCRLLLEKKKNKNSQYDQEL